MIYVTGDIHGHIDIHKLSSRLWPEGRTLTRDDYLVICGDFGNVWDGGNQDRYWLSWLEDKPWTTLWVDGNHENHDLIDGFAVEELFGGRVQRVPGSPHVIHLMRGEVYDLPVGDGSLARCLVMGGATSTDRDWRTPGLSWWEREVPSNEEYDRATASLERVGFSVDYVFTHTCSSGIKPYALRWNYNIMRHDPETDQLEGFLQWVDERLDKERLKVWYFGHYHADMVCRDEHHALLYQQIVRLGDLPVD